MSNQVKHTPGPWFRQPALNGSRIMGGNKRMVACAFQSEADANLIAAAPELLEAAIEIIKGAQNSDGTISKTTSSIALQKLQKAIAKAEGK